ncbi:MAG: low molecular weight protein-tyrosine-phosphatase [Polyangiaceae bacterium]
MTNSGPLNSLLFVCLGNICRSPAAENVMFKLLQDAGLTGRVSCDSAGTSNEHAGQPPDRRMRQAGMNRGLPMSGIARQVTAADLDVFDLIVAMDDANYAALQRLAGATNRHKIQRFCSYLQQHQDTEVPDPWYGGAAGFEHVLDLLEDGCTQLLAQIQRSHQNGT